MSRTLLLVSTLDRAPMHGTGGELVPLAECDPKGVAAKLTEEAAEAFGAWQRMHEMEGDPNASAIDFSESTELDRARLRLIDELADVIVVACDIAKLYRLDLACALLRNERRQIERGRIDG